MTKMLRSYVALLFSFLLLGCSGGSEDTTPETSPSLEQIHIVASPISTRGSSSLILARGNTQPFIATGHYDDGSVKDLTSETSWHSSDNRIATMSSPAALTAIDAGTTTVTASHDGIISNAVQVTVTDAILTAIQITPPSVSLTKGQTQQLTATATYSDNTTANVTSSVAWLPTDITTATVSTTGLLTGRVAGTTELSASLDGITSNRVQITVTDATLSAIQITPPSVSLTKGQTRQLTATATYSDNTTADVTGSVAWLSDDTATATITATGLLTGVEQGSAEVTASLDGVTSDRVTVNVVVTPLFGAFEDISVNDFTFAVDAGFPTTGFDGAEFSLNTPSAPSDYTWSSDAPWVSVDSSGTVSFISQGDAAPVTITATPVSGGEPLAYTFAVTHWFRSDGNNSWVTSSDARSWCRELLPRFTWSIPDTYLLNRPPSSRSIGMLWSEWGYMRKYSNSTFAIGNMPYWAFRPGTTQSYYTVLLGDKSGSINSSPSSGDKYVAVCVLKL